MKEKLEEWMKRLSVAQTGHYAVSERYTCCNNVLGVPLVVLSGFVGAFLFADSPGPLYSLFIKWFGVFVTILASSQTFIRPAEKAELHRSKASKYGELKRRIELHLMLPFDEGSRVAFSKQLMGDWNKVAEDSPVTPHSVRKEIHELMSPSTSTTKVGKFGVLFRYGLTFVGGVFFTASVLYLWA